MIFQFQWLDPIRPDLRWRRHSYHLPMGRIISDTTLVIRYEAAHSIRYTAKYAVSVCHIGIVIHQLCIILYKYPEPIRPSWRR